jgi:hypothetical protein
MRWVPRQPAPGQGAMPGLPLPPEVPAVAAAATDLESTIALVNSVRAALLILGWVREAGDEV